MSSKKTKSQFKISFKKYFPKGRSVYYFDPNVIVSKFPFYQSNHTKALFELERIVRGIDEESSKTIILLGKNFYLKVLILNYFFNNMYSDYLEFLHDLSFSSYFKPSYGLKFDLYTFTKPSKTSPIPKTKRRLKLQFLLINPLKILEYKFTDLVTIKMFRIFLSSGPPLLEKYIGKRLLKHLQKSVSERNILTDIHGKKKKKKKKNKNRNNHHGKGMFFEQDKEKFFGFLKFITEILKFQTEEINHFLEMMGMILRLCHPVGGPDIPKSTLRKLGSVCDFPKGETNLRILACFVHRHLLFWVEKKINRLFRKQQIHHHFVSQIILLPELHESEKERTGRDQEEKEEDEMSMPSEYTSPKINLPIIKKEDLHPFQDLTYNILTEHTYVVSFHQISEAVRFAQSLRIMMKMITTLNDRKFYLMKNLKIYFLNHEKEFKILQSQRSNKEKEEKKKGINERERRRNRRRKKRSDIANSKILSRSFLIDHSFGHFRYDMKDYLYRRKWKYLYDHMISNVNKVFCELDLSEELPLLILAEPSNQEILDNYFIVRFLLNRIITDEKKKRIQRNDILDKIVMIQCIFRGREEREEYEIRFRRYQMKESVKIRRKYAARRIQFWWREYSEKKKIRRIQSTIKIQRWFRKCLISRENTAARIIQYHCRKFLKKKVDRWVDGMLDDTAGIIQRKYRSFKKTDEMLKKRDKLTNYFSYISPQALSMDKLLHARQKGGAITTSEKEYDDEEGDDDDDDESYYDDDDDDDGDVY